MKTVEEFEPITEHPADDFNELIEVLIKNNSELLTFGTLERLINNNIFEYVCSSTEVLMNMQVLNWKLL